MAAVGYGDLAPTTVAGRLIANIVMFCGVAAFALPVSVLTSSFQSNWDKHLKQLEAKKKRRKKMAQESRKAGLNARKIFYSETKPHSYYYKRCGLKLLMTRFTVYDKKEERFDEDSSIEKSSHTSYSPDDVSGNQNQHINYAERNNNVTRDGTTLEQRSPLDDISATASDQDILLSSSQLPQPMDYDNSRVIVPRDLYKKLYAAYIEKVVNSN